MPPTVLCPGRTLLLALCAMLVAACGPAAVADTTIEVGDARMPVPPGPNAAVYMTLTNAGDTDARLVAASSDVAESAELHESTEQDGQMSMAPVDGVDIPTGGTATFEPGGLHLMLLGVDDGLVEGDTISLTLQFEGAAEQTVEATVVPIGDSPTTMHSETDMSSEEAMPSE